MKILTGIKKLKLDDSIENLAKINFGCYDIEILDSKSINKKAFASAGIEKQPDLLYVKFKLVHEGTNKNKDGFFKEDLVKAEKTPVYKSLNWEHNEPVIGVIYSSKFVDPSDQHDVSKSGEKGKAHIICEAAIWKLRYPDEASKIINRYKNETLAFSMEAYYKGVECSVCKSYFVNDKHDEGTYCEHLNSRFDTAYAATYEGGVTRYLKDFIFGAAGVVEDPADVEAEALAIASSNKTKEEVSNLEKKEYTQEQIDALVTKALAEASESENFEALKSELDTLKVSNEAVVKERDQLKVDLESASKEIDQFKTEFESFKTELEKEKVQAERVAVLSDAGVVLPENDEAAKAKIVETIMSMSADAFNLYVESMKSIAAQSPTPERIVPVKGSVNKATAGSAKLPHQIVCEIFDTKL